MDAKSLEILSQLKKSLDEAKQAEKRSEWIETACRFCRTTFAVHKDWKNKPVMCAGCRRERKERYTPGEGDTQFQVNTVFRGGSPGGGRRK